MLAGPYLFWSVSFVVIPLLVIVYYAFTSDEGSFTFSNLAQITTPENLKALGMSILLSFLSTAICLILAYPLAMILSQKQVNQTSFIVLVFILPMWMNFLLRTYAWVAILGKNGLLNTFLGWFGIPHTSILYTNTAILLGMVYNFLPFMVLPIFNSLSKMDSDLINAARDLGANSFQVFTKVIFPLSLPGVVSGITMVFMPAVTTFAISRLLGGGKFMLIGDLIEQQFTVVGDWNFGSAVSIFMMIIILISMAVMSRFEDESDKEGGGLLF